MFKKIKNIVNDLTFCVMGKIPVKNSSTSKVCVFRKDGIGDSVLFFPSCLKIKEHYSSTSSVYFVVPEPLVKIAEEQNLADVIISFNSRKFSNNIFYRFNFFLNLYRENFDIFIYPAHNKELLVLKFIQILKSTTKICTDGDFFSPVEKIVAFNTHLKIVKIDKKIKKEIDKNNEFISELFGTNELDLPKIIINEGWKKKSESYTDHNQITKSDFAIVMPFSGQKFKNWPNERFEEIIIYMREKYNIRSIIVGSADDNQLIDEIANRTSDSGSISGSGIKLEILCSLIQKSLLYVGNDTGLLHISAAVNTNSIGIMGSEFGKRFFPYGDLSRNIGIESPSIETGRGYTTNEVRSNILNITTGLVKENIDQIIENEKDN